MMIVKRFAGFIITLIDWVSSVGELTEQQRSAKGEFILREPLHAFLCLVVLHWYVCRKMQLEM